jgi:hypothetical protein
MVARARATEPPPPVASIVGGESGSYARGTGTLSRNDTLRRTFSVLRRTVGVPAEDAEAEIVDVADMDGLRVPVVEPEARLAARDAAEATLPVPSGDVLRPPRPPPGRPAPRWGA